MPMHCDVKIARLSRDVFLERDEVVMRNAYATQNRLGRLCDERVYENHLAASLRAEGMKSVLTQVPIRLAHGAFSKEYRIDLVADDAIYELKTVTQLIGAHDAQVFNYGILLDVLCVKLLNFRNPKVEGKLRISPISKESRYEYSINASQWNPISSRCETLKKHINSVLSDFGAFLETALYEEALCCLSTAIQTRLPVTCDSIELGTHPVNLISEDVAFCVTAFTTSIDHQRSHLMRLLNCLPLAGLQWINLNHSEIDLVTLVKGMGATE